MKLAILGLLATSLLGTTVYANKDKATPEKEACTCSKECQAECKKGEHKNCKCKHCNCAKGEKCEKCSK